jgi:hypothetical protein
MKLSAIAQRERDVNNKLMSHMRHKVVTIVTKLLVEAGEAEGKLAGMLCRVRGSTPEKPRLAGLFPPEWYLKSRRGETSPAFVTATPPDGRNNLSGERLCFRLFFFT